MTSHVIHGTPAVFPEDQLYVHSFLHLAGITILFYDHLLTFGQEISRIWEFPGSGASIQFLLTRYFAFFSTITITFGNFYESFTATELIGTKSCLNYAFYRQVVLMATQILVGNMQGLRTYALYCKSKRVAALILGVGVVLISLSTWAVTGQEALVSLQQGCHIATSKISSIHIAVAWEALFVFDAMIFVLTILKTYKERVTHNLVGRLDLISLMFRDGAIYFGVMMLAQGANVITFYVAAVRIPLTLNHLVLKRVLTKGTQPALRGALSTLASTVSVTMISRLTLNLHNSAAHSSHINATTIPFSSHVVSTLQLPTQHTSDEIDELEEPEEYSTAHEECDKHGQA